jgi:hypothetical protein
MLLHLIGDGGETLQVITLLMFPLSELFCSYSKEHTWLFD